MTSIAKSGKPMRKTKLILPLLCLALLLSACGGNGGEAAPSPPPADTEAVQPTPTPEPSPEPSPEPEETPAPGREMDPEDVERLEGTWECIGIMLDSKVVMFSEVPELASLYDQILIINGDGTYSYLDAFTHRGEWDPFPFMTTDEAEHYYMFNRRYDISFGSDENDDVVIEEKPSSGSYLINVSDKLSEKLVWVEGIGEDMVYFIYQREDESSGSSPDYGTIGRPAPSPSPSVPADSATTGERNALERAMDYLEFMAFSYSGLVEQLEYEGYLHSEAVYGADHCGADWNEQAALKAASYLEFMSFSRSGLIEQLEYEGFTHAQAVYGAEQNGY